MEETIRKIVREELERVFSANRTDAAHDGLPRVMSVAETSKVLGVNTSKVYEMSRRKGFPAVRDGNRILIPRDALLRWIEQEAFANPGGMECVTRGK